MNTRKNSRDPRAPLAVQVARYALEETLRLSPKNAAQRLLAVVVPPREDDAEVYEEAMQLYLRSFLNSLPGDPKPTYVELIQKTVSTRLARYSEIPHVVLIVRDADAITPEERLMADRVAVVREPNAEDFCRAARATYDTLMPVETANFLVGKPLTTLALAFPKGRSYSASMRKVRAYYRTEEQRQKGTAPTPVKRTPRNDRTLDQLPGYGEAKVWGLRLVDDLADWKSGTIEWSDVDKGVVLMGPPGVGKTVFARALANTCNVPLIHTSAARWVAKGHLGDALKAMRWSFTEARTRGPAIMFVDEIDSLPRRDRDDGDNDTYYKQFVNAFLECLDGIEGRDGVVVVGATNRIRDVEPALLRPGRLERVIEIPLPDADVRNEILRLNLPALPPGRSERFDLATAGWSGADIEQLARDVSRECRIMECNVSMKVLEAALPELKLLDGEVHRRIAIHEAGHALYAKLFERKQVKSIAVSPFGPTRGSVSSGVVIIEEPHAIARTEEWYRGQIAITMAGIGAERLVFGAHADGGGGSEISDLARATHLATCMVAVYGMDATWSSEPTNDAKTLSALRRTDARVHSQVEAVIDGQFRLVSERLAGSKTALRRLAEAVMIKGALDAAEIEDAIAGTLPIKSAEVAPGTRS